MSATTSFIKRRLAAGPGLHLVLMFIILFILAWPSITSLLFFISDTGLRYLQIQELIEHGWRTFAVDYPGYRFDPGLRHVPYYDVYYVINEQLYLSITPFFPFLASLLYAAVGKAGLVLLPVLGGVLTAAAGYFLARYGRLRHPFVFLWGIILCTPVLFYSLELWDHTLASGLALSGVALLAYALQQKARWPLIASGILVSLAIGQRGEVIVLAPALAFALLLVTWPRLQATLLYVVGGVIGAVPVALLNYLWVGHPLGLPLAPRLFGYGIPDYYGVSKALPVVEGTPGTLMLRITHVGRLLFHIERGDSVAAVATLLAILSVFLLVFALRLRRYRTIRVFGLSLVLAVLAYGLWLIRGLEVSLVGLVTSFPLIAFCLVSVNSGDNGAGRHNVYRLLAVSAWLFILFSLLLTMVGYGSHGGAQWGARYLLPAYPMLLYMAFYSYELLRERVQGQLRQALTVTFAGLLIVALVFQLGGVRLLLQGKETHRRPLHDLIGSLPTDVILTNMIQVPSLSAAQEEKIFLWVNDEEEIGSLIPRLAGQGVMRFAVIAGDEMALQPLQQAGQFTVREVEPLVYEIQENALAEP